MKQIATYLALTAMMLLLLCSGYTVSFSRAGAVSKVVFYVQ